MSRINTMETNQQKSHVDSDSDSEQQAERIMAAAAAGGQQSVIPNLLAGFHLSKRNLIGSKNQRATDSKKDEVYQFMRGIMDECTHLKNFSVPINTELIIAIAAMEDAYVPRDDCTHLQDIWPGASIRFLKGGHVSAFLLYLATFRYVVPKFRFFLETSLALVMLKSLLVYII
jgi:Alpha/beta hydrolase domain containing 18